MGVRPTQLTENRKDRLAKLYRILICQMCRPDTHVFHISRFGTNVSFYSACNRRIVLPMPSYLVFYDRPLVPHVNQYINTRPLSRSYDGTLGIINNEFFGDTAEELKCSSVAGKPGIYSLIGNDFRILMAAETEGHNKEPCF